MTNAQGELRSKYQVIAQIGRGGMAEVFLAFARGSAGVDKLCVIKERRAHLAQDAEGLTMFLDEARLAAQLSHPNIVQTYEVGQEAERCFIAMEFLDGQPLNRVRGALKSDETALLAIHLHILAKVLEALDYAHDLTDLQGRRLEIVHRDVTPQNVFVTYDGHTKLVDFGIAKSAHSSAETRTGILKGKVGYMSPEQGRGEPVDRRTDIFAIGVMMWEAISGRRMFKGLTEIATLTRLVQGQIEPLDEICPEAPPELVRITNRALATNKEERYATARQMQEEIDSYLRHVQQYPTAREISALLTVAFAEDRARIKALIEARLGEINSAGVDPSAVPQFDLERVSRLSTTASLVPTGQHTPHTPSTTASLVPTGQHTLHTPSTTASLVPIGQHTPHTPSTTASLVPTGQHTPHTPSTLPSTATNHGSSNAIVAPKNLLSNARIGVAALGLAVGVAAAFYVFRPHPPVPAAPISDNATVAPAAAGNVVTLQVDVTPENARMFLDDALLSTGPYKGNLLKDGRMYRLRVEAPGHTSRLEMVQASNNVRLDISLESASSATSTSRAESKKTRTVTPAPPPVVAPVKPTGRAKQQIDQQNPY